MQESIKRFSTLLIPKPNVLMELRVYFTLMRVGKLISSLFSLKVEDSVVMIPSQKPSKTVIKEAKPYLEAVLYGLKQFKVKDTYQQILPKVSLQTGPKSSLATAMVHYIKVQPRLL